MTNDLEYDGPEEYNTQQLLIEAHARIFALTLEHCGEIQRLMNEEHHLGESSDAERINLAVNVPFDNPPLVTIAVKILQRSSSRTSRNGLIKTHTERYFIVNRWKTPIIINSAEEHHRQAIAEYLVPGAHQQAMQAYAQRGVNEKFLDALSARFTTFFEQIQNGTLPTPPPPWHGMRYDSVNGQM